MPTTYVRAIAHALDNDHLLTRYGINGTQVARRAGLAVETVRKQQRVAEYAPEKVPTIALEKAERIADAIGLPVEDLFCYPNGDEIGVRS